MHAFGRVPAGWFGLAIPLASWRVIAVLHAATSGFGPPHAGMASVIDSAARSVLPPIFSERPLTIMTCLPSRGPAGTGARDPARSQPSDGARHTPPPAAAHTGPRPGPP